MDQYAAHYVPLSSTLYLRVNKTWNVFMKTGLSNNTKKPWCVKLDFFVEDSERNVCQYTCMDELEISQSLHCIV